MAFVNVSQLLVSCSCRSRYTIGSCDMHTMRALGKRKTILKSVAVSLSSSFIFAHITALGVGFLLRQDVSFMYM